MFFPSCIFLTLVISKLCEGYGQFLSSISGEVSEGNFTYYSMSYDGTILIELMSTSGDCDLYVSQKKIKPGFEPNENCLQSVTCGTDTVMVPRSFKRPIGIGVYGHPSYQVSSYLLLFYRMEDFRDILHFDPYSEALESHIYQKAKDSGDKESQESKDDLKSFLWAFLKSLALFIVEVVL